MSATQAIGMAFAGASALGELRKGQALAAQYTGQAQGYEVQAKYERLKGRQEALKHKTEANNQLQAILENLATATAVAGAGNVDPFTGSAEGTKKRILDIGGMNVITATENARITQLVGQFQASQLNYHAGQLRLAGDEVERQAKFGALMTLAAGTFNFYQAGGMGQLTSFFSTTPSTSSIGGGFGDFSGGV